MLSYNRLVKYIQHPYKQRYSDGKSGFNTIHCLNLMLISVHSGQLMRGESSSPRDIAGPSGKFWTATYDIIIPLLNPQVMKITFKYCNVMNTRNLAIVNRGNLTNSFLYYYPYKSEYH
jgi:hypothetical protein